MKTVLVVDDLPANVDVVLNHLTMAGYRVLYAGSGERALKQLEVSVPDLILLDLRMPGLDGIATCQALKANPARAQVPVLFMTAADEIDQKLAAFGAGAVDYVTKAILPEEVEARVRCTCNCANCRRSSSARTPHCKGRSSCGATRRPSWRACSTKPL